MNKKEYIIPETEVLSFAWLNDLCQEINIGISDGSGDADGGEGLGKQNAWDMEEVDAGPNSMWE